jgi:DNA-binding CsgD family transcriptional regulator
MGRGGSGAAAAYLGRALREPPADGDRAQVLLELGAAQARIGDPAGAEHLAAAVATLADPVARAEASVLRARVLMATGQVVATAAVLDEALADLAGRDRELELQLSAEFLAVARLARETRPRALELFERLEVPDRGTTPGERALLAQVSAELCALDRPWQETASTAQRALEGGHLAVHEGPESFTACYSLGVVEQFDAAHEAATAAIDDARAKGSVWRFVHVSFVRGEIDLKRGRLDAAEADVRQGLEAMGGEPWPLARALLVRVLADVLIERGRLDDAAAELAASGMVGQPVAIYPQNSLTHTHGRLLLAQGDARAAADELIACGERQDEWRVPSPAMTPWRSSAAEALVACGDREQALRLAREEVALAERIGAPRTLGIAQRALALASPDGEQVELLREACATLEDAGAPLEHARALTDLGAALRRADVRSEARVTLARALDMAHSCGAGALVDRADKELLAAGSRHRRVALEGPDALTPSERRIAELAASGTTNRELAQSLFVTVKTVEMHLANAYRKLGIRSRADLSRALARDRDVPG